MTSTAHSIIQRAEALRAAEQNPATQYRQSARAIHDELRRLELMTRTSARRPGVYHSAVRHALMAVRELEEAAVVAEGLETTCGAQ